MCPPVFEPCTPPLVPDAGGVSILVDTAMKIRTYIHTYIHAYVHTCHVGAAQADWFWRAVAFLPAPLSTLGCSGCSPAVFLPR